MHYSVLNRATVRVADTRDVSGRVTADSINNGSRAERGSSLWRACELTIFCSVISVGVLASLTPVSAFAGPGGIPAEIAQLKAQVAALQSQVKALQDQLAAVQSNNALKLGPFVTVDPNPENGVRGPNITFKGANIHIVSGSGATDDNLSNGGTLTGLGNLIIGYDELFAGEIANRGGSHNLVIGRFHTFTSSAWGGLVAGEQNTIQAANATVSGGSGNTVSGDLGSVSGGFANLANGSLAAVNGGFSNVASGAESSVSGGFANTAGGFQTVVIGGFFNTDNKPQSIAPQPPFP
jgi:outer membrane murein-binding lipoprotein Lpp